jgi:hypothetical protein
MKKIVKAVAGALLAGGVFATAAAPANASVHVGFGLLGPVVYPSPYYVPPPCYRYGPYACPRPAYYGPRYYGHWGPRYYRDWDPGWYGWHPVHHFRRW